MKKGIFQILISAILLLVSLWCLLWVFSSGSLASDFCNSAFSLFHENFRCRQPYIAFISWLAFSILGLLSLIFGVKNVRKFEHT